MREPRSNPLAFEQFASALGNGHGLELLDILVQRERSVERLARAAGLTINNTSQHLQRPWRTSLVSSRPEVSASGSATTAATIPGQSSITAGHGAGIR